MYALRQGYTQKNSYDLHTRRDVLPAMNAYKISISAYLSPHLFVYLSAQRDRINIYNAISITHTNYSTGVFGLSNHPDYWISNKKLNLLNKIIYSQDL
jgi:hypothetical protein